MGFDLRRQQGHRRAVGVRICKGGCKSRNCCAKPRAPRGAIFYSPTHTPTIPLAAVCTTPCGVPIRTAYIQMHLSIRSFMTITHVPVYPENCKARAPDFTGRYHRFPRRLIARRKCCQGRRAQRRGLWSRELSLSLILDLFLACSTLLPSPEKLAVTRNSLLRD